MSEKRKLAFVMITRMQDKHWRVIINEEQVKSAHSILIEVLKSFKEILLKLRLTY